MRAPLVADIQYNSSSNYIHVTRRLSIIWMSKTNKKQPRIRYTGLKLKVRNENIIFYILNQNICWGYSKNRLNETVLLSNKTLC